MLMVSIPSEKCAILQPNKTLEKDDFNFWVETTYPTGSHLSIVCCGCGSCLIIILGPLSLPLFTLGAEWLVASPELELPAADIAGKDGSTIDETFAKSWSVFYSTWHLYIKATATFQWPVQRQPWEKSRACLHTVVVVSLVSSRQILILVVIFVQCVVGGHWLQQEMVPVISW